MKIIRVMEAYSQVKQHIKLMCTLLKKLHKKRDILFMLDLLLSVIVFLIPYFLIVGIFFLRLKGFKKIRKRILQRVPFLVRTPGGGKVFCWITDYLVLRDVYIERVYNRLFCPTKGSIVVDAGAHVGIYTLKTAKEVGNDGLVIAVEPHPANFRLLQVNLSINKVQNVVPFEYALGSFNGRVKLYARLRPALHTMVPPMAPKPEDEYIEVLLITFDSLCKKLNIKNVDLVKIDVEGAELGILEGIRQVSVNKFVIAAYHTRYEMEDIKNVLLQRGYAVKCINGYVYATRARIKSHRL